MTVGAKFVVREIDRGWKEIRKLAKYIKQHKNYAKAGVLAEEANTDSHGKKPTPKRKDGGLHGGLTNVELAMIHEYGAPRANPPLPERSFIRSGFNQNYPEYVRMLTKLMPQIYDRKITPNKALGILGARMSADMKNVITQGDELEPNKPSTIAAKGSSRPLVDTGQLVNSITWAVVEGGE